MYHLERLISVHDDRDKDAQYDVDEETDKEVEIDAAVPPHDTVDITHCGKRREDIISVDETKETFWRCWHVAELYKFHSTSPANDTHRQTAGYMPKIMGFQGLNSKGLRNLWNSETNLDVITDKVYIGDSVTSDN